MFRPLLQGDTKHALRRCIMSPMMFRGRECRQAGLPVKGIACFKAGRGLLTGAMVLLALLLAADAGALSGKVTLDGLAPKLANLPVTKEKKVCGTSKADETLE